MNYSIVFCKKKDTDLDWSVSFGILASGCHEVGVGSVVTVEAGTNIYIDVELSVVTCGNRAVVCVARRNNPLGIFSPVGQNILSEALTCKRSGIPVILGGDGGFGLGRDFLCINHWNLLLSCLYTVDKRTVFCAKSDFSTLTTT